MTDRTFSMLDVDGDGLTDIPFGVYMAGNTGTYVLRKTSLGTPGTYTSVKISDTVAYGMTPIGDRNGDGIEDFAVACHDMFGGVYALTSLGTFPGVYSPMQLLAPGTFTPNSIISVGGLVWWSDYRGSINMYDLSTNTLYSRNDSLCGDGIAVGDFNRDGYIDAACTNYGKRGIQGIFIYYFNGSSFYTYQVLDNTRPWQGITSYDINGDGYWDLIAVGTEVSVWLNTGSSWTEVTVDPALARRASSLYPPFTRVALAGLDCDDDIDIVVSTSCPNSGQPSLVWYENLGDATTWAKHPIETSGYSCFISSRPYPYGLRVGFLDENGGIDIVIVRNNSNELWGYFTDTCGILGWDTNLVVREDPSQRELKAIDVLLGDGGVTLKSREPVSATIYNASGKRVFTATVVGSVFIPLRRGVYFVCSEERVRKVIIR